MKAEELRKMSVADLEKQEKDLKAELFNPAASAPARRTSHGSRPFSGSAS